MEANSARHHDSQRCRRIERVARNKYLNSTPKMYTTLGFQKRLVDRFQDEFLILA
jgi:hypothetical protein